MNIYNERLPFEVVWVRTNRKWLNLYFVVFRGRVIPLYPKTDMVPLKGAQRIADRLNAGYNTGSSRWEFHRSSKEICTSAQRRLRGRS